VEYVENFAVNGGKKAKVFCVKLYVILC
jgi:hypothetical protein